jgi:aspartyl-tRNA(Asn)/glutamyl-tRNA(Gln) amidotransferase subunit C
VIIDFSKEVDYVANLARLSLEPEEKELMAGQLSSILDNAQKIQELNTDGVEPTSHVTELPAVLRDDENKTSLKLNRALQNAPLRQKDYFRVPSITSSDRTAE